MGTQKSGEKKNYKNRITVQIQDFFNLTENKNNNERISISADIILLVKNSNGIEHLTPPFTDWKKF